jgi:NADH dehydrogenase
MATLEPHALREAFGGAEAVVHLAQIGKQTATETFEDVNVGGTRAVAQAARAAGVRRVVYFGGLGVAHYGVKRHCTNAYFLSKLASELELYRSGLETIVFRPSYIVGPGGQFLAELARGLRAGVVERVGKGEYRLQPVAIGDAVEAVQRALDWPAARLPWVVDLVGPEALDYNQWLARLAAVLGVATYEVREVPLVLALERARLEGRLEDLDCLLCDETSDPGPLQTLLVRPLTPLPDALRQALSGVS